MTRHNTMFLILIFCIINLIPSYSQNITRYLQIPTHSSGTFTKFRLKNKGISGKHLKLSYETVPLRNTLRLINRNFKEIHTIKKHSINNFELDISRATILQEKLQREAENNLLASDTQIASMPVSLFQ